MQLRTPKRLILIAALSLATPACLDTNNSPAPVDMAGDLGPADQGGDTPVDADLGVDMPVDMGPCGGTCTDGKVCDPSDGQCVGCVDDSQCGGDTPACDPATRACVGCVDAGDCTGGVCNTATNTCVQCVNDDSCDGATPRCEVASNACVACLDHPDCPSTNAAQCAGNSCVACSDNAHCAHLTDTPICDGGSCVQCTVATEDVDCARTVEGEDKVFSCDPVTSACTDVEKRSRSRCETCTADSQCVDGFFCVPMEYMGQPRPGGYCLRPIADGCLAPFRTPTPMRMSLSGRVDEFCGIAESLTTCEAVNAFASGVPCANDATVCGDGGLCKDLKVVNEVCTIPCDDEAQCTTSRTCGLNGFCGTEN